MALSLSQAKLVFWKDQHRLYHKPKCSFNILLVLRSPILISNIKVLWNCIIDTAVCSCFGLLWLKYPKSLYVLLIYSHLILILYISELNFSSHVTHYFGNYIFNILNLSKVAFRKCLLLLRKTKSYFWKLLLFRDPWKQFFGLHGKIIKIWRQSKLIFYKLKCTQKCPKL